MIEARDGFAFVIDTKDYAGNFERETCAAVTGQVGECEVGRDVAEGATVEIAALPKGKALLAWFDKHVSHIPDDHGCSRPCSIYQSPGGKGDYNSIAIWIDARPPAWIVEVMKARATAFLAMPAKWRKAVAVTGFRLVEIIPATTREEAL